MSFTLHRCVSARTTRDGFVSRREFLRGISTTALAAGALTWTDMMTAKADELRKQGRACILLYMQGGASQFETFSPLPGHGNGGETKAIDTNVAGIQIAEHFPEMAKTADLYTIIRSMTSKEGSHPRASYLLHTGYLPTASIKHPSIGSITAHEIADPTSELPSYVRVGGRGNFATGGFLGVKYDPFDIANATQPPVNSKPTTDTVRYRERLDLLDRIQSDFARTNPAEVNDQKQLYGQASRMILSPEMKAFDLNQESSKARAAYGTSAFGSGCLLARRLVEAGVPFVEVVSGNWDTHQDNFAKVKDLAGQVDRPMAALLRDLQERGRLDDTMVVWMGEFGRTPTINPRGGRDHYPRVFTTWVAGGGVKGGRVLGKTDRSGSAPEERPVSVADFLQTICHSLKIDAAKQNMSAIGRPIKIVDGGSPVMELFS